MQVLDMRGQPCPLPVVRAKKALEQAGAGGVVVLVDNVVAVQNLEKMAAGLGFGFSSDRRDADSYAVTLQTDGAAEIQRPAAEPAPVDRATDGGITVLLTKDRMGDGDPELGAILMKGFLFSLTELPIPPAVVIFVNSGVRLAVRDSNALGDLQTLAERGTRLLACGTCLNYYGLTEKLAAGAVCNMYDITEALAGPGKVITL